MTEACSQMAPEAPNRHEPTRAERGRGRRARKRAMKDARTIGLWAIIVSLALLPFAWLLVAASLARPMSWGTWIAATAVADVLLCLLIGNVSMILGLTMWLIDRKSETAKTITRFGAALGLIVFTITGIVGFFSPRQGGS